MSTDTIEILTPILLGAIAVVVAVRWTFRNASTAHDALISPPVFAICGSSIGISFGMVWFADQEGRVVIEKGMLGLVGGGFLGMMAGAAAKDRYARLKRGKAAAFVLTMVLLGGSIGAPIGWLVGNVTAIGIDREQVSIDRMMRGIAIGSGVGLLLAMSDLVFRMRRC